MNDNIKTEMIPSITLIIDLPFNEPVSLFNRDVTNERATSAKNEYHCVDIDKPIILQIR